MKSLLKRAKAEAMAYFNSPIAKNKKGNEDRGVRYDDKNKPRTAFKMGKSRSKIGKMHGEV